VPESLVYRTLPIVEAIRIKEYSHSTDYSISSINHHDCIFNKSSAGQHYLLVTSPPAAKQTHTATLEIGCIIPMIVKREILIR
jgi:hypothetical protein